MTASKPVSTIPESPEVIQSPTIEVFCDGGPGALGHPRVYYVIGDEGYVECGYCDRRFVLKPEAKTASAH